MLKFFRNIFKSRLGVFITLGFIALIGIAFAVGDVASTGSRGGLTGEDNVAVVGSEKISTLQFSDAASNALEQVRQQNPTVSMPAFVQQGGLADVLDQLLDRKAISQWGIANGLRAGTNLVNSEIQRIPAFAGLDGKFSESTYRAAIASRKLTDAQVRGEIADSMLAQQVLVPASFGARMPGKIALRYAALAKERRQGSIAILPSELFAPTGAPTDAQLTNFYNANRAQFIRPERRELRYLVFGEEALGSIEPTDAEIAARYNQNKAAMYTGREERRLSQLIVPTRAAAEAIASRVAGGGSLETAAKEAGLEVAQIPAIDQQKLSGQSSADVAKAVFAAGQGRIAAPAKGSLGWYVVRVDGITRTADRSLAVARGEIVAALRGEKRTRALSELSSNVEQQIDEGNALTDIAQTVKAQLQTTKPIVADGRVYGPGVTETVPDVLRPALASAFEMDEGQPQITATADGKQFLVFETARITPSAAAPLKEIRDDVIAAWRRDEGSKAAQAAADRVVAAVGKGQPLAAALAAEKIKVPPARPINMTREDLAKQGQNVPPPLALMFSMAKNSVKRLQGAGNAGWFVVRLDSIEPGKVAAGDPLVAQAGQAFQQLLGREYSEALRAAIRKDVGVERNQAAIGAVRKRLVGEN